jgi:NSS family neurotransmitter:Na+ symporter
MAVPTTDRGQWSGRLGFVLAAAGSAIGLGNIWRFPYSAGEGGGGIFVLVYLLFVFGIGVPVLLAELAIGRSTERNPVGAFKALVPGSWWPALGALGVLTGFGILAFYSVVAGWTLGYVYLTLAGRLARAATADQSEAVFTALIANPGVAILLTAAFLGITVWIVAGGVSRGIERTARVLMPALFLLLVILAIRSLTLPGAGAGVRYLFQPQLSELTPAVVMGALGQALFSLSLGMGAMITYGSYFPKGQNLPVAGASVAVFDTAIAILAGLIIFPALFALQVDPGAGPGLVFVVLPTVFNSMPAGTVFGLLFYVLLAIAAVTSTISLLEVVVAYFVDERGWNRRRAAALIGGGCFLLAIPSALSQGAHEGLTRMGWLDIQNIVFGNYSLSIGALLICVFVGWRWGIPKALAALEQGGFPLPASGLFGFLVRVVCPVAIAVVLGFIVLTGRYF